MEKCQTIRKRPIMQLLAVAVVLLSVSVIETTHGVKIDLMQYHHYKSPYATPNLSLEHRVLIAAQSSRERAQAISNLRNNGPALQEPVFSAQGSYIMEVQVGTPPQTKIAIADTGSDLFWLQCDCSAGSCFQQPDPPFDPTNSTTYGIASCTNTVCFGLGSEGGCDFSGQCQYFYQYGDGSTTQGVLASDVLTLESETFPIEFGCSDQNQGTFNETDGLVGLGPGASSLISQLGSSFNYTFSYCLVSFYDSINQTSPLVFGDSESSLSHKFTPLLKIDNGFYDVNLTGILVNGTELNIPPGAFSDGFILDSGTTITQLQTAGYTPLLSAVQSLVTYPPVNGQLLGGFNACYTPDVSTPEWPTVTFQFDGVDVALPGDNLFLRVDNETFCMAITESDQSFGIFGNVQQQNFNIVYNQSPGEMNVGFSEPTTC